MADTPHIFISYKRKDHKFAFELKQWLEEADFSVWIDQEKLKAGEDWREEIDEAIKKSFALILILTPAATKSKYIVYEFAFAWALGIKVIPVMLKHVKPKAIHPRLDGRHYIGGYEWDKLATRLHEIVVERRATKHHFSPDTPASVSNAITKLDSPISHERVSAIQSLAQNRDSTAYEWLIHEANENLFRDVRVNASIEIIKSHPDNAAQIISPLIESLQYANEEGYAVAKKALIGLGETAIPQLIEAWRSDSSNLYISNTEKVLLEIGASIIPQLAEILQVSEDVNIKQDVIGLFSKMKDAKTIPHLINALEDPSSRVRLAAVGAVQEYIRFGIEGIEAIFPNLELLLTDEEISETSFLPISYLTMEVLFDTGSPKAYEAITPYLIQLLANKELFPLDRDKRRFCDMAAEFLEAIGTPEALAAVAKWRKGQDKPLA